MIEINDPRGSRWNRWDPHIHTPETILNDQYAGTDPWDEFLRRVESSNPPIRALGITDYFSVETYVKTLQFKAAGRLPSVGLIFPNIEMRYGIGTGRGAPINVHLLVCPVDSDHVEQIRRFLRSLTFDAFGESYRCESSDLMRLGKAHDPTVTSDKQALAAGVTQFKINPDLLRAEWKRSTWIQENVLIAVAAGSGDGTSGLQTADSSLATPRGTPENRPMGDTSKPANGIRQDKVVITHNGPWRQ